MSANGIYETTIIVNAGLDDIAIEPVITGLTDFIQNNGGTIQTVNKWGRRKLEYPIEKKNMGYYVYIMYEAPKNIQPKLQRHFFLETNVIRELTFELTPKALAFRRKQAELQPISIVEVGSGKNTPAEEVVVVAEKITDVVIN